MLDVFYEIVSHWPFISIAAVLWIVGHFFERSVFTRERVLTYHPKKVLNRTRLEKLHHWFFYWGRESMEIHPLIVGAVIGLAWPNPEEATPPWPTIASVAYFAGAGFTSLFGWLVLTRLLGRVGMSSNGIRFPGESEPPPR